jgi:hypothetical protein
MSHWPSSAGACAPFCACCPVRHAVGLPLNSNVRRHKARALMSAPVLKHPGTGRPCVILEPAQLSDAPPYAANAGKYVLFLASSRPGASVSIEQARRWLDSGAAYVCAWGPEAETVEESFDYASFLPEIGEPLVYTLMTTSHAGEELGEALWFAFWNTSPPEDLDADLRLVVIQTDSEPLVAQARIWVESNRK